MRKAIHVLAVVAFIACLILTVHARIAYPQPIYEPRYPGDPAYTGEVVEYLDRGGHWEVQWVLVYDPENPGWVEVFQSDAMFFVFVGLFSLAAIFYSPKRSTKKTRPLFSEKTE